MEHRIQTTTWKYRPAVSGRRVAGPRTSDEFHPAVTRYCRRATAATELVMILPLLMVIVFGGMDLARAVRFYMVISNAARVGAEYGATHRFTSHTYSAWKSRIQDAVTEELAEIDDDPALDEFEIKVSTNRIDNPTDTELVLVRVEVKTNFEPTFKWPGLPATIELKHHVHMRQFR